MANPQIKAQPSEPTSLELKLAFKIVEYTHDTATSLLDGFTALRKAQGMGTSTDEQQDLLRAMLLFACAGLDSSAKQIIQDAMPRLALHHEGARDELRKFAVRRLRRGEEADGSTLDATFLIDILIGDSRANLIEAFKNDLTGASLQSTAQLHKVATALGVGSDKDVTQAIGALKDTFDVRNKIAHEMDINFASVNRNRNGRGRNDMVKRSNDVLTVADAILRAVDAELVACPPA